MRKPPPFDFKASLTDSSSIISKLQRVPGETENRRRVAYFYCDGNYPEKQNYRYIFGSIVRQILSRIYDTAIFAQLKTLPERSQNLQQDVLLSTLETIALQSSDEWHIVIDGLDECADRTILLDMLLRLNDMHTLCVIVTSRHEDDIKRTFNELQSLEMDLASVQHDIAIYVDAKLEKLRRMSDEFKEELKTTLLAKSDGMFVAQVILLMRLGFDGRNANLIIFSH